MALESIGATGNGRNYVDVVKTVNKAPQTQVKAVEEVVKKTTPTAPASVNNAPVSAEAKSAENLNQKEEEINSSKIKDAVDKVIDLFSKTRNNKEFVEMMKKIHWV